MTETANPLPPTEAGACSRPRPGIPSMLRFIVKRLLSTVGLMVVVSLILLGIREISLGDVAIQVLGQFSSEEQRQLWLEAHGYLRDIGVVIGGLRLVAGR